MDDLAPPVRRQRRPSGRAARNRYERARAGLLEAYRKLEAAVDDIPDPQEAERLVRDDVAQVLAEMSSARAVLRARQIRRIADTREMGLTELGQLVGGLTRQRIHAILQADRTPALANHTTEE